MTPTGPTDAGGHWLIAGDVQHSQSHSHMTRSISRLYGPRHGSVALGRCVHCNDYRNYDYDLCVLRIFVQCR